MSAELLSEGGLSLDRLQSFCLVARAGGVTKAAQGEPNKQTLYSRQIKELEEFFGVQLIRRNARGISLTTAGERLNVVARECFSSLQDFKSECKGLPVEVIIGAGESIIDWLLMPRLAVVRKMIPGVQIKFLNLASDTVVRRLSDGVLDFGIVREDAASKPLKSIPLGTLGYSLFLPSDLLPFGGSSDPGLKILESVPLATLEGDGSFRRELAALSTKNKLKLKIEIECASFPLAARAVRAGGLAAVLPAIAALDFGPEVRQIQLKAFRSLERKICLAWNPRFLKIRTALEKARKTFVEVFKL
jgi:DNA-binding transcriptional LysR family regulator